MLFYDGLPQCPRHVLDSATRVEARSTGASPSFWGVLAQVRDGFPKFQETRPIVLLASRLRACLMRFGLAEARAFATANKETFLPMDSRALKCARKTFTNEDGRSVGDQNTKEVAIFLWRKFGRGFMLQLEKYLEQQDKMHFEIDALDFTDEDFLGNP